jgi:aryl-alcohol dehydrogenase-like predicted oxidoreductase
MAGMRLALGTVQFGMAYGIAGSGNVVPAAEARRILRAAWYAGVRSLDTAAAYGDSETKLAALCDGLAFEVVSKVPAIPPNLSSSDAVAFSLAAADLSRKRLGPLLRALMCHRAGDLLGERGAAVREALQRWSDREGVAFGASCYDPQTMLALRDAGPIAIAQLPASALDQRLPQALPAALPGLEIHLRSVFLQGLLLMPYDAACARLPAAASALQRWHAWVQAAGLVPLVAALAVARSFAAASTAVVGVETCAQFDAIAEAWSRVRPLPAPQLAEPDLSVIDPRCWTTPSTT